jgi:putative oxidoreductase
MTRAAAAVLFIDISVAILSTKIPILLGRGLGPFALPRLPRYGFWSFIHEARVDFSMWLGCLFLVLAGPGGTSLDARLARRSRGG